MLPTALQYQNRPARKQAEKMVETHSAHELDYNIWYHKHLGEEKETGKQHAMTRCHIDTDAGFTNGDRLHNPRMCLFFARGSCIHGAECNFLHRIPCELDEPHQDLMHDVFGRDRHRADKEDMSGVGSFYRECRTLYVAGLTITGERETEALLKKHFGEWGQIERLRVIANKNIAFVTYHLRSEAEFAKEAMTNQSLEDNEVLSIRWATDNESVTKKDVLSDQQRALDAIEKSLKQKIGMATPSAFSSMTSYSSAFAAFPTEGLNSSAMNTYGTAAQLTSASLTEAQTNEALTVLSEMAAAREALQRAINSEEQKEKTGSSKTEGGEGDDAEKAEGAEDPSGMNQVGVSVVSKGAGRKDVASGYPIQMTPPIPPVAPTPPSFINRVSQSLIFEIAAKMTEENMLLQQQQKANDKESDSKDGSDQNALPEEVKMLEEYLQTTESEGKGEEQTDLKSENKIASSEGKDGSTFVPTKRLLAESEHIDNETEDNEDEKDEDEGEEKETTSKQIQPKRKRVK
ncbi:putative pre-mRNA-splicing factor cwc2 [Monocercomonoides exilis]|uniref:putative pre-mRNA-splicing factor cwc2 n=1 Tax=Monocercomonoides exilis TaxID=2049356 RepID=UPI003559BA2B|nr:putative pre-mRNA-splicing factor cwc2 [Monocercomonoides exilis]|eukprot:MONOS_5777.1-p1 / transcript=MONOS_5777.1 / gene=MONOS_5777 / organism=Monocercomonoides_exilis_PA203 / gene_product=pre-mRNA-splicing factor cwc2 / transcript_product=pre-mRNA-splicing factor cwc2 / location=Mono_scaffold00173:16251-18237(+) / protein_length=516 / sequence_SO=supercontig / SO=protein_coding / is_pseudo=false